MRSDTEQGLPPDLRGPHVRTVRMCCVLAREALTLERTLSNLVNHAYVLTPTEITLMWQTAPHRLPIPACAT